ncbi:MAG: helix-turn-helix transcriptional regulator [Chloroflexi bacterium]|nr:helix-turn-helix transcriptional regulator [Chloroflexota bacterium]
MEYPRSGRGPRVKWNGEMIRFLRRYLGRTQKELADELGVRQQTISEWETGMYMPRGSSRTLLQMVAERADFIYEAKTITQEEEDADATNLDPGV